MGYVILCGSLAKNPFLFLLDPFEVSSEVIPPCLISLSALASSITSNVQVSLPFYLGSGKFQAELDFLNFKYAEMLPLSSELSLLYTNIFVFLLCLLLLNLVLEKL